MGVFQDTIGQFTLPQMGNTMLYVEIGLIALFWGIIFALLFFQLAYKYRVNIIIKRGTTDVMGGTDRGRIKYVKGIKKLYLARSKKVLDFPDAKCIYNSAWGFFKQGTIYYYKFGLDSYVPIDLKCQLDTDTVKLNPVEADASLLINLKEQMAAKYQKSKWFTQYGPMVIQITMMVLLVVAIYFLVDGIKTASANFGSVSQICSQAIKTSAENAPNVPKPSIPGGFI